MRTFINPLVSSSGVEGTNIFTSQSDTTAAVVYMGRHGDFENKIEELGDGNCRWIQTAISARGQNKQRGNDSNKKIALFGQKPNSNDVRFLGVFVLETRTEDRIVRIRCSDKVEMPNPSTQGLSFFTAKEITEDLITNLEDLAELQLATIENTELSCKTKDDGQFMLRPCYKWNLVLPGLATYLFERHRIPAAQLKNDFKIDRKQVSEFITTDETVLNITSAPIPLSVLLRQIRYILNIYTELSSDNLRFTIRPISNDRDRKKTDKANQKFREMQQRGLIHPCINSNNSIASTMTNDKNNQLKIEARNCIWAGAPGTGKSFKLNQAANIQFKDKTMRVTFHPEYTYYDFVGTYRPRMAKDDEGNTLGKIEYAFVPGPFAKMLKRALWNRNANYCLIIEEINRANAAAVFGDVFQLLDRASEDSEDGSVRMHESEYAICPSEELYEYLMNKQEGNEEMSGTRPSDGIMNELRLPANLYIWATMNSADQGVFPMDTAFKRRWSFVNMAINPSERQDPDYNPESAWDKIRRGINDMLLKHHVQEDKLMGYYFLKKEERDSKENLEKALKEKVLLYLFEDAAKPFRRKIFKNEYNTCEKLRGKLVVDDPNLGVFLEKVWDGIPQQSKPEDTKPATEDVDNADNP